MNQSDIRKDIRSLRKLKLQCRAGTKERIDLHRQILDLKKQLTDPNIPDQDKDPIIAEILKVDTFLNKYASQLDFDLRKFSLDQLKKYLENIKRRKIC